jgi:hypothetical protein
MSSRVREIRGELACACTRSSPPLRLLSLTVQPPRGVLTFREQKYPVVATVKSFTNGEAMRVTGKWRIPARDLKEMAPKLHYMGLGVNTNIWHDFFMGFDIVLRQAPIDHSSSRSGN